MSTDNQTDDSEHRTVDIVGPFRFRFELTESELESVKGADNPFAEIEERPVEWEPIGHADWEVYTGSPAETKED